MYEVKIDQAKYLTSVFFLAAGFSGFLEAVILSPCGAAYVDTKDLFSPKLTSAQNGAIVFAMVASLLLPICVGLLVSGVVAFAFTGLRCAFTAEGVEFCPTLLARNKILWSEIADIRDKGSYYILRKIPSGDASGDMEQANSSLRGSVVCRVPKAFLVKDRDGFLAYLNQVLPAGSAIRACYFPSQQASAAII